VENTYLIARAAGLALGCLGIASVTRGVRSLLRSPETGPAPSEKVLSRGVALKSAEVPRGLPLSARKQMMYSFFLPNP